MGQSNLAGASPIEDEERAGAPADGMARLTTGVRGLDEILGGGVPANRAYLIRGGPGSGKTSLGFHFLEAADNGLFLTFGERESQLRANARALGMGLATTQVLDFSPQSEDLRRADYDILDPAEVEGNGILDRIFEAVADVSPDRVVIDSMTQLRYLAASAQQFRTQALALLRLLTDCGATVFFTSEASEEAPDADLQFLSDGVIEIQANDDERYVTVRKLRGIDFRGGALRARMRPGHGLSVFPEVRPRDAHKAFTMETMRSGIPELDALLQGGLDRGTVTMISGPSGVGKTSVGLQYMKEAAGRGERSMLYTFEERGATLVARARGLGIPLEQMMDTGTLGLKRVEPLDTSEAEFAQEVRDEVEANGTRLVMIDSFSGYRMAMTGGRDVVRPIHALVQYLTNQGVGVILINEVATVASEEFRISDLGASYLADTVIFMQYLELSGELRKAIGVLKKRTGDFQKTLREIALTDYGIQVGQPLTHLRGLLTGKPEFASSN
jgi:circadian clock protein KaiC